ncbi:hypothetical protein [Kordia jejudonensis]|uniref:hypothetical protein n=1 Tax=Kordia jejudonensis TaxID=1348245 RepID=UPI00062906E9|nr:hypothetical protein [Kordia jejudonensis]
MRKLTVIFMTICLFNLLKVHSQITNNVENFQAKLNTVFNDAEFVFDSLNAKKEIDYGFFTKRSKGKSQLKEYTRTSNNSSVYVMIHIFDNNKQVNLIYNELQSSKDASLDIGKEFNLILFIDNIIYEIYAPCSFSPKVWKDFIRETEKLNKFYDFRIACICGGACNFK